MAEAVSSHCVVALRFMNTAALGKRYIQIIMTPPPPRLVSALTYCWCAGHATLTLNERQRQRNWCAVHSLRELFYAQRSSLENMSLCTVGVFVQRMTGKLYCPVWCIVVYKRHTCLPPKW